MAAAHKQGVDRGRPGSPALAPFRGREPAPARAGGATDAEASRPVNEDDASAGEVVEGQDGERDVGDLPRREAADAEDTPQMPPADLKRQQMAERLGIRRDAERRGEDPDAAERTARGEADAGDAGGEDAGGDADAPGAAEGDVIEEAAEPETMVLAVNGKTQSRSFEDIAALAGMSVEEAREKPELAKRFAQRELATEENLQNSKRGTPTRRDAAAPAAADLSEEDGETGQDGSDQPAARRGKPARRDTKALIEAIQISDPSEAAPLLDEHFATVAAEAAREAVHEAEGTRAQSREFQSRINGWAEFLVEHQELKGKPTITAAMSRALDDEMRLDLRNVLIHTEGMAPSEADAALKQVSIGDIQSAHLARAAEGNPHIRKVDKAMAEQVWGKVQAEFGVTGGGGSSSRQQAPASRETRKAALAPQPRRASPAPAAPAAARGGEIPDRRAIAAGMNSRTGRAQHGRLGG